MFDSIDSSIESGNEWKKLIPVIFSTSSIETAKCLIGCTKEHSYYHVHDFINGSDEATLNGIKISTMEKIGFSKYIK